jgi:hypothetical protein
MRTILLAVIIVTITACSVKEESDSNKIPLSNSLHTESKVRLQEQKAYIDTLFRQNREKVRVLIKTSGSDSLTEVLDANWPEDLVSVFNIFADSSGRIVRISELPQSESGDWSIMYSHYFDKTGKTFAYERRIKTFNNFCPGDEEFDQLTDERIIKLYTTSHALVDSTYKMTDEKEQDITSKKCQQEVESNDKIYWDLKEYSVKKGINTATNNV